MTRNPKQQALFEASGAYIMNQRPLVLFLYELMRDHVVPGNVESLMSHLDGVQSLTNGWLAAYAEYVANLLQDEWISVEVQLPLPETKVLTYDAASGLYSTAQWHPPTSQWLDEGAVTVTHWRPLPLSPKT